MLHYPRQRRSYPPAFTLIELLVVISIIALLIAILLPALRAARDTAQSAVCMSDQRQIGIAMMMYANDNSDYLVPSGFLNGGQGVFTETNFYEGSTVTRHLWPALLIKRNYLSGELTRASPGWEVFTCANAPNERGVNVYDSPGWLTYFISYGYNWNDIGSSWGVTGSGDPLVKRYTPARLDEIVDPSNKLLLIDTAQTIDGGAPENPPRGYNRVAQSDGAGSGNLGRPDARHRGAANIVWVDGHSSSVRSPDPADFGALYDVLGNGGVGSLGRPNVWNRLDPGLNPH